MAGQGAQRGYKRSWKNYFLNLRYQLRFTGVMVAIVAVIMAGLGYWVADAAYETTKVAKTDVLGNEFAEEQVKYKQVAKLDESNRRLRIGLVGAGVIICAGLFVYGIRMTHKVAGPLHKIGLHLDKVKGGKFDKVWPLRKGDQLMEFFEHFREAHGALRKRQETDVERLRELLAAADQADLASKSPQLKSCLDDLRQLLASKEASLG
jgi:hypothetical protein